jgi:hypothetical protein
VREQHAARSDLSAAPLRGLEVERIFGGLVYLGWLFTLFSAVLPPPRTIVASPSPVKAKAANRREGEEIRHIIVYTSQHLDHSPARRLDS